MSRVIFVNRFYWPEEPATAQLLTDLAEALAAAGWNVVVITSRPRNPTVARREMRNGVCIQRLASARWSNWRLVGKAVDYVSFLLAASFRLLWIADRQTLVVLMTDPPLLSIGGAIACRVKRARHIQWIQDIYPEIAMELSNQRWLRVLRPLRDASWRAAAACVTLGNAMAGVVRRARVIESRIHTIPNWAPAGVGPAPPTDIERLRTHWDLAGKFVIGYSGNFGRVHELGSVLDIADALRTADEFVFLLVGNGPQRSALEGEAKRRGLTNIKFLSSRPRAELACSLCVPDVHLVTLRSGCDGFVFPSKLYGVAAVAKPIVFLGPRDSEIAALIQQHQLGVALPNGASAAAAQQLQELRRNPQLLARFAQSAARFHTAHTVATATKRWLTLLNNLTSRSAPAVPATPAA